MQHIDNDMDDLFKRAAENYPLRTGEGDWENIAKRMADESDKGVAAPLQNKNNKKIIVLLLALLLLSASWLIVHFSGTQISSAGVVPGDKKERAEKNSTAGMQAQTDQADIPLKKAPGYGIADPGNQGSYHKKITTKAYRNFSMKIMAPAVDDLVPGAVYPGTIDPENGQAKQPITGAEQFNDAGNLKNKDFSPPAKPDHSDKEIAALHPTEQGNQTNIQDTASQAGLGKIKKEKASGPSKNRGLYFGLVMGPEFSKVQSMSFGNTGIYGGVIAGFRLSRKLSLETGISRSKKYYNSRGKDFSMDKVGATMPAGMIIDDLAGESSLIEIPLKAKYDLVNKKNAIFFVAGGVSAYIMTREKNNYDVTMNGNQEKITGVYDKNNYRVPAVINISAGYEKDITKRLHIRIEPFLKIPLKGIGVGSLPVTSAGLQIGLIGRLK